MKKRKVYGIKFALLLALLVLAGLMLVVPARANFTYLNPGPKIVINGDGSITPEPCGIEQNGNTYFLTCDIEGYSLLVKRSNIIIDGMGYTVNCTPYTNIAIHLSSVTNVTVKNFLVDGDAEAVMLGDCLDCIIEDIKTGKTISLVDSNFNMITKCNTSISLYSSNNNSIMKNNIIKIFVGQSLHFNSFFLNNFFLNDYPSVCSDSFWDNGSVGNYWNNYTVFHPQTSEIGYTGIGNTPYEVPRSDYATKTFPNITNIDHYPLIYPYDIENDQIALPQREPLPVYSSPPDLAVGISTALIIGAIVGLLYYKKQHYG